MSKFKFKAKKMTGEEIEGTREAQDQFDLARMLRKEDYILVDFEKEGKKRIVSLSFLKRFGSVSLSEKMIFTRNLAVMLGAGMSVSRALEILIHQTKSSRFKKVLSQISSQLVKGKTLSSSMEEHPKIFSSLYVAMLNAGEKSGKLEESLKLMADQINKDYILSRKVKGAMIYPAIVILAMIAISILMLIYVVPTLVSTFEELEIELPVSTRLIVWFSRSLTTNSVAIIAIFAALVLAFKWLLRTQSVKRMLDSIFLRLPIFSSLIRKINAARTARTLGSLISSGVEIIGALEVTSNVVQNIHYKNVLHRAMEEIRKGSTISAAFKEAEGVYPSLVGEMIAVGEETGKLSEMLVRLAVFYEGEVTEATKDMTTVIEPILMILIGAVVGFFAVAMLKPMYSMLGGM